MCFYALLTIILYICIDSICTKLFLAITGGAGAYFFSTCSTIGIVLLILSIFTSYIRSKRNVILPAILLLIPSILSKLLAITLLIPSWRHWFYNICTTSLFRGVHFRKPANYTPENQTGNEDPADTPHNSSAQANGETIDVETTVHKD